MKKVKEIKVEITIQVSRCYGYHDESDNFIINDLTKNINYQFGDITGYDNFNVDIEVERD